MRKQAWQTYFNTGDKEPLVLAYQKSIRYIASQHYPGNEDMVQIGLIGLLKAIDTLDISRVKSIDAWVFLKVRSEMFKARKWPRTESLDNFYEEDVPYQIPVEYDLDTKIYAENLLKRLPKREAFILRKIYFEDLKRTEVGKLLGVSSMRVGQLEQRALNYLSAIG